NTYSGATTVSAGVLQVANNAALGTTGAATNVADGATLQVDGGRTVAEPLTLGTASGTGATLESVSGANTWTGTIGLPASAAVTVDTGSLAVSGAVIGGGGSTKTG